MALFSLQSSVDIGIGHQILLGQSMGQKSHVLPVKEIEHPVINVTFFSAEFLDAVPEVIRLWASKLMAEHSEPSNGGDALSESLLVPAS